MSDPKYDLIINKMSHLRTHSIYGNHDFEMRHFPVFRFGAVEGKVYLEHGFVPSPWTENPNNPLWEAATFGFKTLRDIEAFFLNLAVSASIISRDDHFAIGVPSGEDERGNYPSENDYPEAQKKYYLDRVRNNFDTLGSRIAIIGHTHHPYLYSDVTPDGEGFIFVDAGAWTEGRSDFVVLTEEEIAICHYKR